MYGIDGFGMDYGASVPTMDNRPATETLGTEKYEVADISIGSQTPIHLIKWFESQGWQGYTNASSFKELLDRWQPSDWQQLVDVILDSQIVKDASEEERVNFKDYLYARKAQAGERVAAEQGAYVPTQAQVDAQNAHNESGIVPGKKPESFKMSAFKKIFPMPVVQLGLGALGYVVGDKLKMPILGAAVGVVAIPIYKSRIPKVVHHSKEALGALLGSTDLDALFTERYEKYLDSLSPWAQAEHRRLRRQAEEAAKFLEQKEIDERAEQQIQDERGSIAPPSNGGSGTSNGGNGTSNGGDTGNKKPFSKVGGMLLTAAGIAATAISYYRNKSILKAIGSSFIAPVYLTYIGIQYVDKGTIKKTGKK